MKGIYIFFLLFMCALLIFSYSHDNIATFSIVAYDPLMEEWGVAVQSKFFAVGAVVPQAQAGIGAIATQAWGNTQFKHMAMDMLQCMSSEEAMTELLKSDSNYQYRQIGIVDMHGNAKAFTGDECSPWAGHIEGKYFAVQGNILSGEEVVKAMAYAFEHTEGTLGQRLLGALEAGQEAGGDSRGMQSAAMLVVSENGGYSGFDDRMIDIRVDDSEEPIEELKRLYYINEETFLSGAYIRIALDAKAEGKLDKSDEAFKRAVAITEKSPNNAQMLNSIAWEMAINDYDLEKALSFAKRAVELMPDDGNIWDTLGEIYFRLGQKDNAVEAEKRAIELMPDSKLFRDKLDKWQE